MYSHYYSLLYLYHKYIRYFIFSTLYNLTQEKHSGLRYNNNTLCNTVASFITDYVELKYNTINFRFIMVLKKRLDFECLWIKFAEY